MSRRQDPIVGVLEYFENQPIEAAVLAFSLVKAVMKRRTAPAAKPKKKKTTKPSAPIVPLTPAQTTAAQELDAIERARATQAEARETAAPTPRRRRTKTAPAPATAAASASVTAPPADLALPGIGPAIVGE